MLLLETKHDNQVNANGAINKVHPIIINQNHTLVLLRLEDFIAGVRVFC